MQILVQRPHDDEIRTASEVDTSHLATKEELKVSIAELKAEMKANKAEIIKWVVGMGFAQIAMFLTILKLH